MTRVRYQIHTEDRDNLDKLASQCFTCCAIWRGVGYWQQTREHAACIDIIGDAADRATVLWLAANIKSFNGQDAVYVTETPVTFTVI
mgnify:CR=1 FL=1